MEILKHLIFFMWNLYTWQEDTIQAEQGETDWWQVNKGVRQGYIFSSYLLNLYPKYILREVRLEEDEYIFKSRERSTNNLHYADNSFLKAENVNELEVLVMKVKEQKKTPVIKYKGDQTNENRYSNQYWN